MSKLESEKVIIDTVYEAIAEAGDKGIPSGHLYAMLMQYGFSLDIYNTVIGILKQTGKINEQFNVLRVS